MKISKTKITVILTILVMAAAACSVKSPVKKLHSGVEYYRNIQFSETPYDIEKGTHSLDPDEAKGVNCYKFTYDDNGRLLTVEYVRNDVLLAYSSLGGAAKISYTYDGSRQTRHYFNKDNEPIESGGFFTAEYTIDPDGNRIGLKFYGRDGAPVENRNKIHSWTWSVLPDGMVRELRYNLANEEVVMNPFCPFYELRFTYNEKGYVTRMANYKADTLYNCTAENCGDIGVSYFTFKPNEHGDLESFSVFNATGQMSNLYWGWSKRVNTFDENGYVVETVYYDQDNEFLGGKNIPVTRYKYDDHGAVTEITSMDKDRNILNNPETGVAITRYIYDDAGNRTQTLKLDRAGVPVTQ